MSDWWERSKHVYQQRGYLVVCKDHEVRIGTRVSKVNLRDSPDEKLPQPFRLIAKTDFADYVEQFKLAGHPLPPRKEGTCYFYRMVTD